MSLKVCAGISDSLITHDTPDLSGGIRFVRSARHSTYVEISAYRQQMERVRKRLGWPGLKPGVFEHLRTRDRGLPARLSRA